MILQFTIDDNEVYVKPINLLYAKGVFDLFAGEQLVMVGRYRTPGMAKVVVSGSIGGKEQTYDFPAKLVKKSSDESFAFIEKLWAVRRVGEILDELDLKGKNRELTEELVKLSTRHGILTPYTSFLADENTRVTDLATNASTATRRLGALSDAYGSSGFEQRAYKGSLQRARTANAPASPSISGMAGGPAPADGMGSMGGYGYGGGRASGQVRGKANLAFQAGRPPGESLAEAEGEMAQARQTVRQIANGACDRREGQGIDSTANEDQQKNAVRVKQFSDEYFRLAKHHGKEFTQYVVFDEPVIVNVSDRTYLIEP